MGVTGIFGLIKLCVRTEDATATFGYKANSAGVGGEHFFDKRSIEGYTATGNAIVDPDISVLEH